MVCRIERGNSGNIEEIRTAIRRKYAEVSVSAKGKFLYPTGRDGALILGYDQKIVSSVSSDLLESFCGVGNPFSLGTITMGEKVLDFGCGAGFDMVVASRLVGPGGRVYGVDLTEEMVERAKKNLTDAGVTNFEIEKVDSEDIPYDNSTFDVVISNGVFNLSPDKRRLFNEIYRVLKPGGRLQFADVVLEGELPLHLSGDSEAWSQ